MSGKGRSGGARWESMLAPPAPARRRSRLFYHCTLSSRRRTMKSKLFLSVSGLTFILALSLATAAKPAPGPDIKFDLGTMIKLPCKGVYGGDVVSTVRVKNETGSPIPKLTKIFLSTSNGSAQRALDADLANGATADLYAPPGPAPTCNAVFFKK
jgi:hypothetical protein